MTLGILGISLGFAACGTKAPPSPALDSAEKKEPEITDSPSRFIHMHLDQMPDMGNGGLGIFSVPPEHSNDAPPSINSPERFLKDAPQRSRYKLQD